MTVACYPLDAVTGAPAYTGRMLRDTLAALVGGASSGRPLGAYSGVRPGTPSNTVTLSGLNWTCKRHAGVLDVQAAAEAGPYLYAVTANETGTLNAQAVGNARSDLLVAQLSDPAEADGTSVPKVEIVYVAGTAGPGAPDPAIPARSMRIGRFNVPASGGGSPTFTWLAPTLFAAGARASVLAVSDLAGITAYANMEATVEATPGAFWKYNGTSWIMHGVAKFADSTTRDAAIASPVAGMVSRLATETFDRRYNGTRWAPDAAEFSPAITLSQVTVSGSGSSRSIVSDGDIAVVTSNTIAIDNFMPVAADAFMVEVTIDVDVCSAAGDVELQMRSAAPATINAGNYGWWNNNVTGTGTSAAGGQAGTDTRMKVGRVETQGQVKLEIYSANRAVYTRVLGRSVDNSFHWLASGIHKLGTAYPGIIISFTNGGLITGTVRVRAKAIR